LGVLVALLATLAGGVALLWHTGRLLPWLIEFGARQQVKEVPELAEPARPWPDQPNPALPNAASIQSARDLYQTTNIWLAHLKFTPEQWKAMTPKRVTPVRRLMKPDGTLDLRNPMRVEAGWPAPLGSTLNGRMPTWHGAEWSSPMSRCDFEATGRI
jgi:hypothetical protein